MAQADSTFDNKFKEGPVQDAVSQTQSSARTAACSCIRTTGKVWQHNVTTCAAQANKAENNTRKLVNRRLSV